MARLCVMGIKENWKSGFLFKTIAAAAMLGMGDLRPAGFLGLPVDTRDCGHQRAYVVLIPGLAVLNFVVRPDPRGTWVSTSIHLLSRRCFHRHRHCPLGTGGHWAWPSNWVPLREWGSREGLWCGAPMPTLHFWRVLDLRDV